ncbi:hypothetical protein JCM11641_007627 [Rhodosporidiobolus odoratus]
MASSTGPTSNSPTQTHASLVARRRDTGGSPAASLSSPISPSNGGGTGGYIGGGFTSKRRGSLGAGTAKGRRWWSSRGRPTKLALLVLGALGVYWVIRGLRGEAKERKKLTYRWWEAEETSPEDLAALLPRPTLPPRPPRPKPPPSLPSHTLNQLLKLPSTVSPSSADYTALLHLTSSSHLSSSHLTPLLNSLSRQSSPPSRILVLVPSGLEPSESILSPFSSLVSTYSYPQHQAPALALANVAQHHITSNYILFVDGNLPTSSSSSSSDPLSKDYARTLLHASGTSPYSASILTAGGLSISSVSADQYSQQIQGQCHYPALSPSPNSRLTTPLTLPSLPFLLSTSWLLPVSPSRPSTSILQGLNTALPLEIALAGALWTKHAIPVFALPIPLSSSSSTPYSDPAAEIDGWACLRLKGSLQADPGAADLFRPSSAAGEGIRRLRASGDRRKGGASPDLEGEKRNRTPAEEADEGRSRLLRSGTMVLLLSGRDEVEAARGMACRFAAGLGSGGGGVDGEDGGVRTDLKVVVADYDLTEAEREKARRSSCHLELTPLGVSPSSSSSSSPSSSSSSSTTAEPISLALVDLLDSLDLPPAFVLYLSDGPRAREYEEVLRWMGGVFGTRKGGERWCRVKAERELLKGVQGKGKGRGRATVVGMKREEAKRAEWVGALELEALRHWHTPRIDLSVVTNDRPVSLHRLLTSLQTAYYFGDDISLSVNLEQTTDRLTHRLVDDLRWPYGSFALRHRILLGGLMPAIVESWYPSSNDTYGVLLEDDVEVSPLFYGWLKFTILQYRYTLAGRKASSHLFGVSLYQQKNIELRPEGRQPFDAHRLFAELNLHSTTPYLSQIPCSWGAAYFPEVWREFHTYLSLRLSELALPISEPLVPAIRSNRWPRSWKKYFIELVYLRGYSMLYPNYPNFESLSTNHLEKGTHVHTSQVEEKKKALFEVPLLDAEASLVDSLPGGVGRERLPHWDALPIMDLWGSLASSEELLERGWQTTRMLGACPSTPNLLALPRYDARELLCRRMWDRETEGRLVDAQPLRGPERAGEDQGRAEAAAAAAAEFGEDGREVQGKGGRAGGRVDERGMAVEGDGVGEVEHAEVVRPRERDSLEQDGRRREWYDVRERAASKTMTATDDDDEDDDARPARPQHDHLYEDASIHEVELDDADAGKRNLLFDADEAEEADAHPRRRGRKPVDLEARERMEEESELGLDENEELGEREDEGVPTVSAFDAGGDWEEEGDEEGADTETAPEKRVRWARAD